MEENTILVIQNGELVCGAGETNRSEILGMLMQAYLKEAHEFIEEHPVDCADCGAFKQQKQLIEAIKAVLLVEDDEDEEEEDEVEEVTNEKGEKVSGFGMRTNEETKDLLHSFLLELSKLGTKKALTKDMVVKIAKQHFK